MCKIENIKTLVVDEFLNTENAASGYSRQNTNAGCEQRL